jgi:hypothetical protein
MEQLVAVDFELLLISTFWTLATNKREVEKPVEDAFAIKTWARFALLEQFVDVEVERREPTRRIPAILLNHGKYLFGSFDVINRT